MKLKGGKIVARVALALLALAGALGAMKIATSGKANAASYTVAVHHVADGPLWLHPNSPVIHSSLTDLMPTGTEFDIQCFSLGDNVFGDRVWDYGTNKRTGHKGYAADKYIDTRVTQGHEPEQLKAQGIPECGNQSLQGSDPNLQPAASVPIFISYNRNAAKNWALAHAEDKPPDAGSCIWFVSQALAAGGFPQTNTWNLRFSNPTLAGTLRYGTDAARIVPDFIQYMRTLPYVQVEYLGHMSTGINNVPDAKPGDVIIYDWEGDGVPDHADVVVGHAKNNPQYPLVSGWSENGSKAVNYQYRGWTWSAEHKPPEWLQSEPGNNNMQAWLIHVRSEDDLHIGS